MFEVARSVAKQRRGVARIFPAPPELEEQAFREVARKESRRLHPVANGGEEGRRVFGREPEEFRKLVVGDVFLDTTLRNLAANGGRIAISVYDAKTLEGYQIRGAAERVSDGPVVAMFKAMVEQMFQGAATAKGALVNMTS